MGGSVTGNIEIGDDQDWFAVDLEGGKRYQIDLEGVPTGRGTLSDPVLQAIRNSSGFVESLDTFNDDGGVGVNSRTTYTPVTTGTHYLVASGVTGSVGTYTLSVIYLGANGASEADTDFAEDNTTSGRVEVGASATGNIGGLADYDWFRVDLQAGKTYQIDLEGEPTGRGTLADTLLESIRYSFGTAIPDTTNDDLDGTSLNSRVTFTPTVAGTYYIVAFSGTASGTGTYTLSVRDVTPPDDSDDLPGDTTLTGEVDVGGSATGNIDIVSDEDWFRIDLEAGKRYQIDLEGADTGRGTLVDPHLTNIRDSSDAEILDTFDDDGGVGVNARIIYTPATTGTYYLVASNALNTTPGTYTLSVIVLGANGLSEADTDFPEPIATSGRVEVGASATGNIGSAADSDWFAVDLEAGKTYRFDMEGQATGRGTLEDPYVRYYDASTGGLTAGDLNSRAVYTPPGDGTYYLEASEATDSNTGTYTLSVRDITPPATQGFREGDTDLPKDASTTGVVEVDGFGARGAILGYTDIDWFAVELEADRTYRVELKGGIKTGPDPGDYHDPELTLAVPEIIAMYDADSNFLHHTSSRYNESTSIHHLAWVEYTPGSEGTYYISASAIGSSTGGYELKVIDITEDPDKHTADRNTSGSVEVGGSATGKIDFSRDVDWFGVELTIGRTYQIDLEGEDTGRGSLRDPQLRGVFDADGNAISGTRDNRGGVGDNARVTFTADADTYFIAVGAFGNYEGTYTLSVTDVTE